MFQFDYNLLPPGRKLRVASGWMNTITLENGVLTKLLTLFSAKHVGASVAPVSDLRLRLEQLLLRQEHRHHGHPLPHLHHPPHCGLLPRNQIQAKIRGKSMIQGIIKKMCSRLLLLWFTGTFLVRRPVSKEIFLLQMMHRYLIKMSRIQI